MKKSRFWFFFLSAVLLVGAAVTLQSFQKPAVVSELFATYSHGVLRANIPYDLPRSGSGQLLVEIVDPEDQVLARSQRQIAVRGGKGSWHEDLKLTKTVATDEIVWHRLRYRFNYDAQHDAAVENTESISQILRMPVMHIVGQQSYLTGGQAGVRVVVTDSGNAAIAGLSNLRVDLLYPNQDVRQLFAGPLNRRGTAEAQFRIPEGLAGTYSMRYAVDTPIGSAEFTQPVRLEDKVSVLLTTEKPIYQPGQTIHVRALALDRANHQATAGALTFELEDSRGNKVFKKVTATDKFGIASAEFSLADEVNLGTYHLRALLGEGAVPTNTSEIALNVERYVLPKFKVAVDFAGKDHAERHGYRPGDHVTGSVRANYFFGKAVDGAELTVKASAMDVALFEAASVHGKTDTEGVYHFDLKLPSYFAGRQLSQGAARVLVEATVKDGAGHSETRGEPITVSDSPLIITAVPEGGTMIPNLENQVFILTSYADGKPASANVTIHAAGNDDQSATTDQGGVAVIRITGSVRTLEVEANDKEGNHASSSVPLETRPGSEQILLRTERAVYRAGDRIQLRIFSTKKKGTAYVDVAKEGQTVLTRDLDIVNGKAELALTATPELAGTLDFNAYLFGGDARPVGDHRLVFVQPADELKIEATTDSPAYKPGDEARIGFRVTNARGEGVQAALGAQIVDEAVFALAEKQPGFAKVFFYLEQEAMKPRYEIHSLGMPEVVEATAKSQADQKDRAARALFSATELVNTNKFETEFGRSAPQTKREAYAQRYRARFYAQASRLAEDLAHSNSSSAAGDLTKLVATLDGPDVFDPWHTKLSVERTPWTYQNQYYYVVRSAGLDKKFGTSDDLVSYLIVSATLTSPSWCGDVFNTNIERRPFNVGVELVGAVCDPTGALVPNAALSAKNVGTGAMYAAGTTGSGGYVINLPAGKYELTAKVMGFKTSVVKNIIIEAGATAWQDVKLELGSTADSIIVTDMADLLKTERAEISHNVTMEQADNLPVLTIGGIGTGLRNPMQVVNLLPGASFSTGGFNAQTIRINGLPGNAQAIKIDGQDAANGLWRRAGVDAIQEIAIQTSNFAAEFGQAGGGVFNLSMKSGGAAAPHVRSYFPEALYMNPEIITDQNGLASITIPVADSITTWRMALMASTTRGALGSGTSSLKVFQDFFVDLDLPVTLTQGDRVSIPVAIYNYSGSRGDVSLQLKQDDWFSLVEDVPTKNLPVDSGKVGGSQFTLEAKRIGKFKLMLGAAMTGASKGADIVIREIEVIPNGREQSLVFNGRLENTVQHEVNFPASSVADASKILVRLYPGPLSQVIEGMDSILRMPGGCFEQTSSSTYPNVLALDYMKRTKKLTPEVHAKAEGYIGNGYQRLVTFEVPGGGFSWFGQAPANKILTAYGLMEFSDMSKVYDVDPRLIQRTQQWLAAQQQPDGSWKPDSNFINEGATNRFNSDALRITAYIAWSLENTGYQGQAVEKARQFVETHMSAGKLDAYTLAVLANFAADHGKSSEFTRRAMQLLLDARAEKGEEISWTAEETGVYGRGASASVETTALAAQALLKWSGGSGAAAKALRYIASKKDASGTWGTTQATIMALRALLLSTEKGSADVRGTLEVSLNGDPVEQLTLSPENNDLLHQFVMKGVNSRGTNRVDIRFNGSGSLAYQVVGQYFVPWEEKPVAEALSIDVTYDRTQLEQDDIATATAKVKNNLAQVANMVMVDLGIPPGFDLLSEDLQSYREKSAKQKSGRLEKFSQTATQAILYFDSLAPGETVTLPFRLRAKYPIRARTFASRAYEYYDPEVNTVARPVQLEIRQR